MANPERARSSWQGTVQECAKAVKALFKDGLIEYDACWDDPADEEKMTTLREPLLKLQAIVPRLNARWSTIMKAILHLMATQEWFQEAPSRSVERRAVAGAEATKVRNICYHIRREWYRKSQKPWMEPFPNPNPGAVAAAPMTSATPGETVAPAAAAPSTSATPGGTIVALTAAAPMTSATPGATVAPNATPGAIAAPTSPAPETSAPPGGTIATHTTSAAAAAKTFGTRVFSRFAGHDWDYDEQNLDVSSVTTLSTSESSDEDFGPMDDGEKKLPLAPPSEAHCEHHHKRRRLAKNDGPPSEAHCEHHHKIQGLSEDDFAKNDGPGYTYGMEGEQAWRQLVSEDGAILGERELSSHIETNDEGQLVAQFLDCSSAILAGQRPLRKRHPVRARAFVTKRLRCKQDTTMTTPRLYSWRSR